MRMRLAKYKRSRHSESIRINLDFGVSARIQLNIIIARLLEGTRVDVTKKTGK